MSISLLVQTGAPCFGGGQTIKKLQLVLVFRVWLVGEDEQLGRYMMQPESGPLRAVKLSRHKWLGGLVN